MVIASVNPHDYLDEDRVGPANDQSMGHIPVHHLTGTCVQSTGLLLPHMCCKTIHFPCLAYGTQEINPFLHPGTQKTPPLASWTSSISSVWAFLHAFSGPCICLHMCELMGWENSAFWKVLPGDCPSGSQPALGHLFLPPIEMLIQKLKS